MIHFRVNILTESKSDTLFAALMKRSVVCRESPVFAMVTDFIVIYLDLRVLAAGR